MSVHPEVAEDKLVLYVKKGEIGPNKSIHLGLPWIGPC